MQSSRTTRVFALIAALVLGYSFLFSQAKASWTSYWLLRDGQEGTAIITKVLWTGHNGVAYRYNVNQKEYTGSSARNWKNPRYSSVQVGERSVVYFSASHPWLSLLYMPPAVVEGLPVILLGLVFEFFFIMTVIDPKSKWALDLSGKRQGTNH